MSPVAGLSMGLACAVGFVWLWAAGRNQEPVLQPPVLVPPIKQPPRASSSFVPPPVQHEKQLPTWEVVEAFSGGASGYTTKIVGVARFNGSSTATYATVEFDVYDANDNRVGTAFDSITHLAPGSTWRIEAIYFGQNGDHFGSARFSGW